MSAKDLPALAEMRLKIAEMEKDNLSLQNQVELLNNEIEQKNVILNQTNSELSGLQTQYKQALDKIVELSQRTSEKLLTSEEERIYRNQLAEQSVCISTLQDRLWESEHQRKLSYLSDSSNGSSNTNNTYYTNKNNKSYRTGFCDPIPNIERAEKKIMRLHQKLSELAKENEFYESELKHWSNFNIRIFNIVTESLNEYPGYPSDNPCAQRKITYNLVEALANLKCDATKIYAKYQEIKEKYESAKEYLRSIEKRCNHLSEVTKLTHPKHSFDGHQKERNNEDYDEYHRKEVNYRKHSTHRNILDDEEYISEDDLVVPNERTNQSEKRSEKFKDIQSSARKQRYFKDQNDVKQQNVVKSTLNIIKNTDIDVDPKYEEEESNLDCESEEGHNRNEGKKCLTPRQKSCSKILQNNRKQVINKSSMRKVPQTDPVNKKGQNFVKKGILKSKENQDDSKNVCWSESAKQKWSSTSRKVDNTNTYKDHQSLKQSLNQTYPQNRNSNYESSDDDDDAYRKFGQGINRLTKITKKMKEDYYDFARFTDDMNDSYSIEEISKINSNNV